VKSRNAQRQLAHGEKSSRSESCGDLRDLSETQPHLRRATLGRKVRSRFSMSRRPLVQAHLASKVGMISITAVIAIHNEEAYIANCLRHLVRDGIDLLLIDHGSDDGSAQIYLRREFASRLVDVIRLPSLGVFSLADQLRRKMDAIASLETDWLIHIDADEVMHSPLPSERLDEAIARAAARGYTAVNFDEFVFLPIGGDYVPDACGEQTLSYYYFFQPSAPRLVRAWKRGADLSPLEHGGHLLTGRELRLSPEYLILKHYIFRNQAHAFAKYSTRHFDAGEIARGWHYNRTNLPMGALRMPHARGLKRLINPDDRVMDRSDPWPRHYWEHSSRAQRRSLCGGG
jgi:glycosyltransferase involved in cell wall biosynthesis